MKAESVGDDERVGRRRNQLRLRQSNLAQLIARDRPHELRLRLTRAFAGPDAHAPFPFEPLWRQTVRARDIDEWHCLGRDVGQEQPCLDGRVKRIGVEIALRIGGAVDRAAQHGLDIDHWRRGR